ncbi:MAG: hypothetical protein RJA70_253 [Pseudomonadota bacterium]|jgi:arylsulfatase A-like enzyme
MNTIYALGRTAAWIVVGSCVKGLGILTGNEAISGGMGHIGGLGARVGVALLRTVRDFRLQGLAALLIFTVACSSETGAGGVGTAGTTATPGSGGVPANVGGQGGMAPGIATVTSGAGGQPPIVPGVGGMMVAGGAGGMPVVAQPCQDTDQLVGRIVDGQASPISGCDVGLASGPPQILGDALFKLSQAKGGAADTLVIYCKGFVAKRLQITQCGQDLGDVVLMKSPNILFAIADDASQDSFDPASPASRYVDTPSFDALAEAGVWFQNAYDSNPKCAPARATLLTGRHFWQNGEAANHYGNFPADLPRYTKILSDNGWNVAYTGKGWGPGTNLGFGTGKAFDGKPAAARPASGIKNSDYSGNFKTFLDQAPAGQPWTFWYGASEPHRDYERGSGVKNGKQLADAYVPKYFPDEPGIREDLLDYAVEVEWYDKHLGEIVAHLRSAGLLANTIVVATSDHGMPFPRVKGNVYEQGHRVPLAVSWPAAIQPGRSVIDFVNFPDFGPTYLELAGIRPPSSMTGKSFLDVLLAAKSGQVDPARDFVVTGKERHDPCSKDPDDPTIKDASYPIRAIRRGNYLYLHNYKPKRWPASDPPQYTNIDPSPTLTRLIALRDDPNLGHFFELSMGYRPEEELYDVTTDPDCVENLASDPTLAGKKQELRTQMEAFLVLHEDPRQLGTGDVFEHYEHFIALQCQ